MCLKDGRFILYDHYQKSFLLVGRDRKIERVIGARGAGPGEYTGVVNHCIDEKENLYAYDALQGRIVIFSAPDYRFAKSLQPNCFVSSLSARKNTIYAVDAYTEKIIKIIDSSGKITHNFHKLESEDFRLFTCRFVACNILPTDKYFLFIYADRYQFYYYDHSGKLIKKVSFPEDKHTPVASEFLKSLSPYDISDKHWSYWNSFLRPVLLHWINDQYFLCLLEQSKTFLPSKHFINIHDKDGNLLLKGISLPQGQLLCGCSGNKIYCIDKDSESDPSQGVKVYVYRIEVN
ncbi:MAG: 6-bladed beta-propeller [Chloroherpetonaceae bacterium]|nr:6-bladed beta-propeller [Chloroherpetonaceae bacterium]